MTNTSTPVARTIEAVDSGLIDLHHELNMVTDDYGINRDAMLAAVRAATMHLRYGRIERAAEILDGLNGDRWTVGL